MRHIPVLLKEVVDGLNLHAGDAALDCTVGDGGHTEAILHATQPQGHVIGIDSDPRSLERAKKRLTHYHDRLTLVQGNFRELSQLVAPYARHVRGILLDLGWSSSQLLDGQGLSFMEDAPLDMRLSGSGVRTAASLLANSSEHELGEIFRKYGGERMWRQIAHAVVAQRRKHPITRTGQLVRIIENIAVVFPRGRIHPATRIFQALRIAVNDELAGLTEALPQTVSLLAPGGRIAVITFHSLEDRIVKHFFARCSLLDVITKKPIVPTVREIADNPRSRSAKLRIAQKK